MACARYSVLEQVGQGAYGIVCAAQAGGGTFWFQCFQCFSSPPVKMNWGWGNPRERCHEEDRERFWAHHMFGGPVLWSFPGSGEGMRGCPWFNVWNAVPRCSILNSIYKTCILFTVTMYSQYYFLSFLVLVFIVFLTLDWKWVACRYPFNKVRIAIQTSQEGRFGRFVMLYHIQST